MDQSKSGSMEKLQKESVVTCSRFKLMEKLKINKLTKLKKEATENIDTKDGISDNTISLTERTPNNSPRKQYPTRHQKPVKRYELEDK